MFVWFVAKKGVSREGKKIPLQKNEKKKNEFRDQPWWRLSE